MIGAARDRLAGVQRRVPWGVALTFDGAASPVLLDTLRALDVRATFFVLRQEVQSRPDLVLRMRAEGHGVGSRVHDDVPLVALDRAAIDAEIEGVVVALQLVLGRRTRLFRPPSDQLTRRVAIAMRRARLDSWLWSVDAVEHVDALRERDVVRFAADRVEAVTDVVEIARSLDLDFVAL